MAADPQGRVMILGHTLPEVRKATVELIFAVAALVGFFIAFDPKLTDAVIAVALALIGVIGVYQSRSSATDVGKSLTALVVATVGLVAFFGEFKPDETEQWIAIATAAIKVGSVFMVRNET